MGRPKGSKNKKPYKRKATVVAVKHARGARKLQSLNPSPFASRTPEKASKTQLALAKKVAARLAILNGIQTAEAEMSNPTTGYQTDEKSIPMSIKDLDSISVMVEAMSVEIKDTISDALTGKADQFKTLLQVFGQVASLANVCNYIRARQEALQQ